MSKIDFKHIEIEEEEEEHTPQLNSSRQMNREARRIEREYLGKHSKTQGCSTKTWIVVALVQLLIIAVLLYLLKSAQPIDSPLNQQVSKSNLEGSVTKVDIEDNASKGDRETPKDIQIVKQKAGKAESAKKEQRKEDGILKWPTDMPDYNVNGSFNLWDISPKEKTELLKNYKNLPGAERPVMTGNFIEINYDKDEHFLPYSQGFENDLQVIDWSQIHLLEGQIKLMQQEYKSTLAKREKIIDGMLSKYKQEYLGKTGFLDAKKEVTYEVFLNSLETQKLTGHDFKGKEDLRKIYQREKEYHQKKFNTGDYQNELHACVVAPTYNNNKDYRYAWHIESLLQQEYSNYRVVIIDDASPDGTSDKIAKYLNWRKVSQDKFILLRNKVRRTALENIYYTTHKYCDFNQMAFIVDGDDELVGTQVFKLYNALYQKDKLYVLYSNFISYDSYYSNAPLSIGISEKYPLDVIQSVSYRTYSHSYSHLRTMMTDLFMFQRVESLEDDQGKFYWTLYDNAIYYPALEMSCGRVTYIPQLKYWYTANTGINDWRTPRKEEYKAVAKHISRQQKRYHCIDNVFQVMKGVLEIDLQH